MRQVRLHEARAGQGDTRRGVDRRRALAGICRPGEGGSEATRPDSPGVAAEPSWHIVALVEVTPT